MSRENQHVYLYIDFLNIERWFQKFCVSLNCNFLMVGKSLERFSPIWLRCGIWPCGPEMSKKNPYQTESVSIRTTFWNHGSLGDELLDFCWVMSMVNTWISRWWNFLFAATLEHPKGTTKEGLGIQEIWTSPRHVLYSVFFPILIWLWHILALCP